MKDASVSMLAMIQSVQVFAAFMPGFAEARAKMTGADGSIRGDVRQGEAVAGVLALSFGALASSMSDDPRPLLFSMAVTAGMVVAYEWIIRQPMAPTTEVTA